MDAKHLEDLYSKNVEIIEYILNKFIKDNQSVFDFDIFHNGNMWFKIWRAIIYLLTDYEMDKMHLLALNSARILSRDKISLEHNNVGKDINCFLEMAHLIPNKSTLTAKSSSELDEVAIYFDSIEKKKIAEALKCLCNLVYQSTECRQYCVNNNAVDHIIHRMSSNVCVSHEIELFDVKLLFLITALERSVVDRVLIELNGFTYILENLNQKLHIDSHADDQLNTIVHLLKTIYNIMFFSPNSFCTNEIENLRLLAVIRALIFRFGEMINHNHREVISNCVNVLVQTSNNYLSELIINSHHPDKEVIFQNYNVYAIRVLINFFHSMAENLESSKRNNESILPVLTVLCECVSCNRILRHYIRSEILPPLKDVSQRPEVGKELRNYLCRLQCNPDDNVRKLTYTLLYLCCKKNAERIIKYFGYGNAAGLLCEKGLLDCRRITTELSSDSDESDTEDYKKIQHSVNPITGTYHVSNFTTNMTEEEKEFHAMKLVGDIDKLQRSGVIKPCKIDENGTIQPVDHILQLQDGLQNKCNINNNNT